MSDYNSMDKNQPIGQNVSFNIQRSYTFINNSLFYPLIPSHLFDYYNRFIRAYMYWYDGYDPLFHTANSGIMSTRIAYTLCNKLAKNVVGTNIMFDALEKSGEVSKNVKGYEDLDGLHTIEKWAEDVDLVGKLKTLVSFGFAGGDSLIKLDGYKKRPYPNMLRKDNYFLTSDLSDKIVDATMLIYTWTNNKTKNGDVKDEHDFYYIVEQRKFVDGKPMYKIYVKMGKGNVTTVKEIDVRDVQEVEWKKLPRALRDSIKEMYPSVTLGQWKPLPFEDSLGLYLFKNSDNVSFIPQMNFGESLLSNIMVYMMMYDYAVSAIATDLHNGRGRVILPKPMQNSQDNSTSGHFGEFQDGFYAMFDYLDPEKQKPLPIQFDLRGMDWTTLLKLLKRLIASALDISERTIGQWLTEGTEKATAREISVDDATANFISEKRKYLERPLNDMLDDVESFFGFKKSKVKVRFSRVGLTNMMETVTQMSTLKDRGLVDLKTALVYLYPDMNDEQIETMKANIEKEEQTKIKNAQMKSPDKDPVDEQDSSEEGIEQQNNTDISHLKKSE